MNVIKSYYERNQGLIRDDIIVQKECTSEVGSTNV